MGDFNISALLKEAKDRKWDDRTLAQRSADSAQNLQEESIRRLNSDERTLLSALSRLVAEEKNQSNGRSFVKMKLDGPVLTLTSTSVSGRVYDEMECTHEGEEIEIGFNCRFLINSVRAAEGETVRLTLKNPRSCLTIEPLEEAPDESYFYMVLPVRISEG
jgi:DNA polymerase-3 subunit beta